MFICCAVRVCLAIYVRSTCYRSNNTTRGLWDYAVRCERIALSHGLVVGFGVHVAVLFTTIEHMIIAVINGRDRINIKRQIFEVVVAVVVSVDRLRIRI